MEITAAVSREGTPSPALERVQIEDPHPGEILVRVVATGICHTDLHAHDGTGMPIPRPVVLGHEGAGVVERVGEGVFHVKPGDHVVMSGSSCGTCPQCLSAMPTYCREAMPRAFGSQRPDGSTALSQGGEKLHSHFFGQSSFATYAIADAKGAVPVPKDVPLDIVAPMGCGIITGAGAVFYAFGMRPGQTIVIFGCGGVGLSAVMAARLCGAKAIIAVDPIAERRALAEELGATHSIDAAGEVEAAVREIAPDGVNFTFNTTTVNSVYDLAVKVLGMRGVAGFVTRPRDPWTPQIASILAGGRSLRGILGGDAAPQVAIPMMIDYWRQGRFPIEKMIRHYPFEDIGRAWDENRNLAAIKPVLRMES